MLRNIVLSAASVIALTAAANAADVYPVGGGYKDGPAYVAINWSGLYLGAHVGGAWDDLKVHETSETGSFKNNTSAVFGGGQVGYNFQRGNIVYGAEIDLGGIGFSKSKKSPLDSTDGSKIESGFYTDVTGRLGYTVDHTLVYAKGGYAYYDGSVSAKDVTWNSHTGLSGWTVGGGVEYKINPAWSVKAEYQYFDFGSERIVAGGDAFNNTLTVQTVKGGVNYFVGNVYEPLK